MNYKEHVKGGFLVAAVVTMGTTLLKQPFRPESGIEAAVIFGLCLFGSLIPDLDTQSKISRFVCFVTAAFCTYSIYYREPYPAIYAATIILYIKSLNHRTWTHVYLVPLILFFVSYKTQTIYFAVFALGVIAHYSLDRMNPLKLNNWVKPIKLR